MTSGQKIAIIGASNFFAGSQPKEDLPRNFAFFGRSGLCHTGEALDAAMKAALASKPRMIVLAGDVVGNCATPHPRRRRRMPPGHLAPEEIIQLVGRLSRQCDEVKFQTFHYNRSTHYFTTNNILRTV